MFVQNKPFERYTDETDCIAVILFYSYVLLLYPFNIEARCPGTTHQQSELGQ